MSHPQYNSENASVNVGPTAPSAPDRAGMQMPSAALLDSLRKTPRKSPPWSLS